MKAFSLFPLIGLLFLFSCTEGNESPSEKEVDPAPTQTSVDSAAYFNGRSDDSVSKVTPNKETN